MSTKYAAWIAANVVDPTGACSETTQAMLDAFPELKRVRGHYYCPIWGEREHWWLVDGVEIVDPTAAQFPSKGIGHYEPWDESQQEPTGLCPNCGDHCYDGNYCCTEQCHNAYVTFCTRPL